MALRRDAQCARDSWKGAALPAEAPKTQISAPGERSGALPIRGPAPSVVVIGWRFDDLGERTYPRVGMLR